MGARVVLKLPPAELTIPKAGKVKVGPHPQDKVLQTLVTPVLVEALMSLQNLIIKQDAYTLDKISKQSLQRHDQIRLLITINNEAKVRRSTKLVVLGKAKVMSYRTLRKHERSPKSAVPEVEEASADKRKCGRKRKSAALEADAPEPTAKVARMSEASEPAMAPVAQMIALDSQNDLSAI
ncbi:hypothetical protein V2W45_1465110 [Cenococcum geophilum]